MRTYYTERLLKSTSFVKNTKQIPKNGGEKKESNTVSCWVGTTFSFNRAWSSTVVASEFIGRIKTFTGPSAVDEGYVLCILIYSASGFQGKDWRDTEQ